MDASRRELPFLIPILAAAAQADNARLVSQTWRYEDLPVKVNGENRSRAVFNGESIRGFPMEMHETELAPGLAPHPPHSHPHHELLILREGTLEVTIKGNTQQLGPGSIAYIASNDHHGWRNIGSTRARYFVMAFGRDRT